MMNDLGQRFSNYGSQKEFWCVAIGGSLPEENTVTGVEREVKTFFFF